MTEKDRVIQDPEKIAALRLLEFIPRPYVQKLHLLESGPASLINREITIAYRDFGTNVYRYKLLVGRNRSIPIISRKTGREKAIPYENEDELRGDFAVLFKHLAVSPTVFYIGEKYKVTCERPPFKDSSSFVDLKLESTNKIVEEGVGSREDFKVVLKSLSDWTNLAPVSFQEFTI